MILLCNISFAVLWVYYLLGEIRSLLRQRLPRVYLGLFLCCNAETLQREIKVEEYRERTLRPVISNLDDVIDYLKDRKGTYEKGNLPVEDQKLRALIAHAVSLAKEVGVTKKYNKQDTVQSVWSKINAQESKSGKRLRGN